MDRTAAFRRHLSNRFLQLAGVALVGSPLATTGCGSDVSIETGASAASGSGGGSSVNGATSTVSTGSGTGTSGSSGSGGGGSGGATVGSSVTSGAGCGLLTQCIPWNGTPDSCPSATDALTSFQGMGCPNGCWTYSVDSPPTYDEATGSCCYETTTDPCIGTGRPFVVDAEARVAPLRPGDGWLERGEDPDVSAIDPRLRAALADAWTRDALLEHASVASFSRLSLELLAVGAPADLVEGAHRAALDEVRHARLCFALASAYRGAPVEPAAFPLERSVEISSTLAEVAARSVTEGCIGETLAAVQASEQLERASDPAVRLALEAIVADESRHAELAWRTVVWALSIGGDDVRSAVRRAFADAARALPSGDGGAAPELCQHGRLDAPTLRKALARGLREVVLPCARALLRAYEEPRAPRGDAAAA